MTRPLSMTTVAVAITLLTACQRSMPSTAGSAAEAAATPAPANRVALDQAAQARGGITMATAAETMRADHITAPGLITLDDTRTARVGSLQEGQVLDVLRQVGDAVASGGLLATLHGHAVHDAWAGYKKAIAERRRAEKELSYTVDALGRAQRLIADKAIALQDVQRAEVDEVAAREQLDMARAEVRRSIEELEHIGIVVPDSGSGAAVAETTEQIPVRSPIAGTVLERLVTPGTTVTPGMPLFVVSDLTAVWAIAEVDERHLATLRVGRSVTVKVAAYPQDTFAGTITAIGDVVNAQTRRVTVRASVANRDRRLKPEMFAAIQLGDGETRPTIVVPASAIQSIDGSTMVFVSPEPGTFVARRVELGEQADGAVLVRSGLRAGETYAATGTFVLKSELLEATGGGGN